jgi:hypothetical protein
MFDLNFINIVIRIFKMMTDILPPKYVSRHQNVMQKRKDLTFTDMESIGSIENNNDYYICIYVTNTYFDYFDVKMTNFFANCHKYKRNIASSLL